MKRLIYRIEDKWGLGFYQTPEVDEEYRLELHLYKKRHVAPMDDKGIDRCSREGEKCGFLNEAQLYNWLDKDKIRRLEKYGLKLVRIYREVIAIGQAQVLYIEKGAENGTEN